MGRHRELERHAIGERDESSASLIVEWAMTDRARDPNADKLVVTTIDIPTRASDEILIALVEEFVGLATWHRVRVLGGTFANCSGSLARAGKKMGSQRDGRVVPMGERSGGMARGVCLTTLACT